MNVLGFVDILISTKCFTKMCSDTLISFARLVVLLCVYQDWKSRGDFNFLTWDPCWMFVEFVLRFVFQFFHNPSISSRNLINIEWKMLTIFWFSFFHPHKHFSILSMVSLLFSWKIHCQTVQFDFEDLRIVSWDIKIHSQPAIRHQSIISWCNQSRVECEGEWAQKSDILYCKRQRRRLIWEKSQTCEMADKSSSEFSLCINRSQQQFCHVKWSDEREAERKFKQKTHT